MLEDSNSGVRSAILERLDGPEVWDGGDPPNLQPRQGKPCYGPAE